MTYRFENKVKPSDFWLLSMHHTYHSTVGICNIVFTLAMFALVYRFGKTVGDAVEVLLFFGCILFPVLQPFFVYLRARGQAMLIPEKLVLTFDDRGLFVEVGTQTQSIPWKKITSVTKEYNMVIVCSDARHGYIITNRMLGKQKQDFWAFIQSKIQ